MSRRIHVSLGNGSSVDEDVLPAKVFFDNMHPDFLQAGKVDDILQLQELRAGTLVGSNRALRSKFMDEREVDSIRFDSIHGSERIS